jgi:HAD superfamily hydrolase (TIGR01490 family)
MAGCLLPTFYDREVPAAFFDLDKTVIAKPSIAAFSPAFRKGGFINRRTLAKTIAGQVVYLSFGANQERMDRIRESVLSVIAGWDSKAVREMVRDTMLQTIEPLIYDEALELMEMHRLRGDRIYLVSASPEEIVEPLGEMLGVDGAIASKGEIDQDGRYTGKVAFYSQGPFKAQAMQENAKREGFDLAACFAYSDSATDIPMLEAVGTAIAVNPDRVLQRIAKERGWEIRHFSQPVRLRDRVPVHRNALTTLTAVACGSIVFGIWRLRRHYISRADLAPKLS